MGIWKKNISVDELNKICENTAVESLGIKITNIGENSIEGEMGVNSKTHQPRGILHGGASVLFAETLGSLGGVVSTDEGFTTVGLDINANHLRPAFDGVVIGIATPIHIGRTTQVWEIKINHKESKKPICISRLTLAVVKK